MICTSETRFACCQHASARKPKAIEEGGGGGVMAAEVQEQCSGAHLQRFDFVFLLRFNDAQLVL